MRITNWLLASNKPKQRAPKFTKVEISNVGLLFDRLGAPPVAATTTLFRSVGDRSEQMLLELSPEEAQFLVWNLQDFLTRCNTKP